MLTSMCDLSSETDMKFCLTVTNISKFSKKIQNMSNTY